MKYHPIDFDKVINQFGGDLSLLQETAALSLEVIPQHLQKIQAALISENTAMIEFTAHSLRGSVSLYHYKELSEAIIHLENIAKNSTPIEFGSSLHSAYAVVRGHCEQLIHVLLQFSTYR